MAPRARVDRRARGSGAEDRAVQRPLLLPLGGLDIVGKPLDGVELSEEQRQRHTTMTLELGEPARQRRRGTCRRWTGARRATATRRRRREQSTRLSSQPSAPTRRGLPLCSRPRRTTRDNGALRWYASSFEVAGYDASVDTTLFHCALLRRARPELLRDPSAACRALGAASIDWRESRVMLEEVSNFKLSRGTTGTEPIRVASAAAPATRAHRAALVHATAPRVVRRHQRESPGGREFPSG